MDVDVCDRTMVERVEECHMGPSSRMRPSLPTITASLCAFTSSDAMHVLS